MVYRKKKSFIKRVILNGNPQRKTFVIRARIVTPKKPNSARRPCAKLGLMITPKGRRYARYKRFTLAYIPGINHNVRKHGRILIRGGGARDLPAVSYTCIRGVYDLACVQNRTRRRSLYGVESKKKSKLRRIFRRTLGMM